MNIWMMIPKPVFEAEDETGSGENPAGDQAEDKSQADLISGGDQGEEGKEDSEGSDTLITGDDDKSGEDEASFDDTPLEFNEETFTEDFKETIPEGFEPDAEGFKEFIDGFNNASTRGEMVKHALDTFKEYLDAGQQAQADQWSETMKDWQKATREHPEFGGENLDQSLANARSVAETFGGKDFLNLLKLTGAGNHPAMVEFLNKIHAEVPQEAQPLSGEVPSTAQKSLADKLFGGSQ